MGKQLILQRRGRGTIIFKAKGANAVGRVTFRNYDEVERLSKISGKVVDIVHSNMSNAPLITISYEDGTNSLIPAPLNIRVGDTVEAGIQASIKEGSILPLKAIPEGTTIYNIELKPGDGGRLVRSCGTSAKLMSHVKDKSLIIMPSKQQKLIDSEARAAIGIIAAGDRKEKPMLKAGNASYKHRAKGRRYPVQSGVAMNAVDHPFGCGRGRHVGKPKTVARHLPAGRKVGKIAARRTGRLRK